jgi:uncharacterized protein (TIRG00374 family)
MVISIRWQFLLRSIKPVTLRALFPLVSIGYMGNNIYPARAGEVLRAVILKRKEGVPVSASLATIIVERIFDGVVMLAFIFVNLPVGKTGRIRLWEYSTVSVGTGIPRRAWIFLLAAMFPHHCKTERVMSVMPQRLREKTIDIMNKFLDGLASLRSPFNVLMVFFTSVIIWLLETGKYWFVMHAFDFNVSFFALMLMKVLSIHNHLSAPGYTAHSTRCIAVLTAAEYQATAAGYTLTLHVALWLPITLLGAYFMAREGLKWSDSLREETTE